MLTGMGANYSPVATIWPHVRRSPLEGVPFFGGQGLGGMVGMALLPQFQQMMGQVGMLPMGLGHDQNVYDRMMQQRYSLARMQAMQSASQLDRQNFMQGFRGIAALTGTPWGYEQRQAANQMAGLMSAGAPIFADMFPDMLDALGGARGSATVLSSRVMDAGRYRIDPLTGRMGMSQQSSTFLSQRLFESLYEPGNVARMHGITAGRAGELFQHLQQRGMIGTVDRRSGIMQAAQDLNISGTDVDQLGSDPRVIERLRNIDANKVRGQIQAYTGAISAMRDIFGDLGRPNAPMSELVNALEALTAGGMSQFDPGRLTMLARTTHNLARQTGVSVGNALIMQQHAASRAAAMGIEPIFAVTAAQGGMAYGGAYRGLGYGAHPAWGLMNADQQQQMDTNLRVQAAASPVANRLAAAMRIAEMGGVRPGSDADALISAIRGQRDTWSPAGGGPARSVTMENDEFLRIMTQGRPGLNTNDVMSILGQTNVNRQYVDQYGIQDIVRRRQGPDEVLPFIASSLQNTIASRLGDTIGDRTRAAQIAADISPGVMEGIRALPPAVLANDSQRNQAIGSLITNALQQRGALNNMTAAQQADFGRSTADIFRGTADESLRRSRYGGTLINWLHQTSPAVLNAAAAQQLEAQMTSQAQNDLAGLGRGSMMQRIVEAVRNAGDRANDPAALQRIIADATGGVSTDDINQRLTPHLNALRTMDTQLNDMQTRILQTPAGPARDALLAQHNALRNQRLGHISALADIGTQTGFISAGTIGVEQTLQGANALTALTRAQNDLVGLRGGFGAQVTPQEIAAAQAEMQGRGVTLSADEARSYVLARRRSLPASANAAQIDAVMAQYGGSRDDAVSLANLRLMAERLGVSPTDIAAVRGGQTTASSERGAIEEMFRRHSAMMFNVTDADRAGAGTVTDAEVAAFMAANPQYGSAAAARAEILSRRVIGGRQGQQSELWDRLWGSPDGAEFRNRGDAVMRAAEDSAERLVQSPQSVQRLGERALDYHRQLRSGTSRLRALAAQHTGGDIHKLLMGDIRISGATQQGRDLLASVKEEVAGILAQQQGIYQSMQEGIGAPQPARTPEEAAQLEAMRAAAAAQDSVPPETLMKDLLSAYGFAPGETLSDSQRGLAQRLGTAGGRGLGRTLLDSINSLRSVAERRADGPGGIGGVERMIEEYQGIMLGPDNQRDARMRSFQQSYGFDTSGAPGQAQWRDFERNIRLQEFGFSRIRRGAGGLVGGADFESTLDRFLQTGQQVRSIPGATGQGASSGVAYTISGHVTLGVDPAGQQFLNMTGANLQGGGRNYTPNPS